MQLSEKEIEIDAHESAATSFIIERFEVPDLLSSLMFRLDVPEHPIDIVLIYDSQYNLRAELTGITAKKRFIISEDEMLASSGTKVGAIAVGEWIMALQIAGKPHDKNWACRYSIEGFMSDDII
ncbi:hypothetical protein ACTQ5J_12230 [Fundicoccus sp. Sow4_F4]|uniref:hypothetical protein n=1 Tax=Fundicoccus sp. Sow4_F4 TaxID=3438783 RepID=UPI003F8F4C46